MRIPLIFLAVFLVGCQRQVDIPVSALQQEASTSITAKVVSVYDGDTFVIETQSLGGIMAQLPNAKVRVRDIDTPELGAKAKCDVESKRALVAKKKTQGLISASGNEVVLKDVDWDKYGGRIDAEVFLKDGRNLATVLSSEGLGRYYAGGTRLGWC